MPDTHKQLSLRDRVAERHLTGWRYALVVVMGGMVLMAALLMLGLGVAAKMGVDIGSTETPAPQQKVVATKDDTATPANPQTPPAVTAPAPETSSVVSVPQAADTQVQAAADPTVCDSITATYRGVVDDLAKAKPALPVVGSVLGATVKLLRGQYNDKATDYNNKLDAYQADFLQKTRENACQAVSSPFVALSKASLL